MLCYFANLCPGARPGGVRTRARTRAHAQMGQPELEQSVACLDAPVVPRSRRRALVGLADRLARRRPAPCAQQPFGERRGRPNKAAAPRQAPPPAPSPPCRRSGPWRARRRDVHSARSEPLQAVAGSSQVSYRRAGREQLFAGLSPHCRARPSRRSVRSSSAAGRSPGSRRRAGGGRGADRGLGGCCPQAAIAPPRPAATAAA